MNDPIPTPTREAIVAAAVQAPSSHNTQPWLFELGDRTVDVYADRTRALPVNDPHDRELTISCGAAVFNLLVAARHHDLEPSVWTFPDDGDPDLLARIELAPADSSSPGPLFEMIGTRRTTREPFADDAVPDGLAETLADLAAGHGVSMRLVEGHDRAQLSDLVAEGDRAQFADPRWRRELASWMHPRRHGEGLVVPEVLGLATRAVVSLVDLGESTGDKDHELLESAPVVAVLSTEHDDPEAWLTAGQALEHVLLTAARDDVHAGYLNQPCQVEGLRDRLRQLDPERRYPQVVVRLGRVAASPSAAPRRPIAAVLVDAAA